MLVANKMHRFGRIALESIVSGTLSLGSTSAPAAFAASDSRAVLLRAYWMLCEA
jgi:hypothetical protein